MHFSLEDVSHDAPTYYHLTSDVFSPYSHTARLDRFLVPSDALTHPLVLPTVSIPHHSTNFSVAPPIGFRRSFSDHLPVRLTFSSGPSDGSRRPSIPVWIAKCPAFAEALRSRTTQLSSRPFRALEQYKKTMFVAAKVARRVKLVASTINLKVSQRVALFKLVAPLTQDFARIDFLLGLDPALTSTVRAGSP